MKNEYNSNTRDDSKLVAAHRTGRHQTIQDFFLP